MRTAGRWTEALDALEDAYEAVNDVLLEEI